MIKNRVFTDIDLNFTPNPITGDVSLRHNEDSIKQSVYNLIMTNFYERKFNSNIGSQVTSLLFENYTPFFDVLIKNAITQTITNFEPRVSINEINITPQSENNSIAVALVYTIINTTNPITINLILRRTR